MHIKIHRKITSLNDRHMHFVTVDGSYDHLNVMHVVCLTVHFVFFLTHIWTPSLSCGSLAEASFKQAAPACLSRLMS